MAPEGWGSAGGAGGGERTAPSSMRTARLPWDVVTRELSAVCSLWVSNLVGTPDRLKVILPSTSDSTVPSATADGWWRTVVMASGPMEPASSGAIDLIAAAQDSAAMAGRGRAAALAGALSCEW